MKLAMTALLATALLSTSISALALPLTDGAVPETLPRDASPIEADPEAKPSRKTRGFGNINPSLPHVHPGGTFETPTKPDGQRIGPGGNGGGETIQKPGGETSTKTGANPLGGHLKARGFGDINLSLPQVRPGGTFETPTKPDGQRIGPGGNGGGETF